MTFFMIPLMVVEGRSIRESMKEGKEMMLKTFGTNIVSGLGIQVIAIFFGFLTVILAIAIGSAIQPVLGIVIGVIGIGLILMWVAAAETVSVAALYVFAKTGEMPQIYKDKGMNSFQFNV